MHKFIRWYNQNRVEFFIGVALIAFVFIIIRVLNGFAKVEQEQKKNELSLRNNSISTSQSTATSRVNESVITGVKISEQTTNSNKTIIKKFVDYCNDVKVEEAYNMLTDECKEVMYPTLKDFVSNYFLKIFDIVRIYSLENWYSENDSFTYYVKYTEDVLATGNANSSNNKSDYITVVYTDSGYRLNIGGYVGREDQNESVTKNGVELKVNWLDSYIDYTILNITVINNFGSTICLDTKESIDTVFLYDENSVKYTAFLNEIAEEQLVIENGLETTLNIKFSKIYNPSRAIKGVAFRDVVLNYDNYIQGTQKKIGIALNT